MNETIWGVDDVAWTSIRHGLNVWDRDELRIWINNNIEGDYRVTASYIFFKDERDAVLYRLKYT